MKGQRRFKVKEIVRYRPLECMGTIWDKTKLPDGRTNYIILLHDNIENKLFVSDDGTLLEHLSE